MLLNGAITLMFGVMIFKNYPLSSLWVIGVLIGLEFIFNGWTWIMLSLLIRSLPKDD